MTSTYSKGATRWVKPYKDFPLTYHPSGQLCKKVRGRLRYFGSADDWRAALAIYEFERPYLDKGDVPPPLPQAMGPGGCSTTTVDYIANLFLTRELKRRDRGAISLSSYRECKASMAELIAYFGRDRGLETIRPEEFADFRHYMATRERTKSITRRRKGGTHETTTKPLRPLGPNTLGRRITYIRMCFDWAERNGHLERRVRIGDEFRRPSKAERREARVAWRKKHGLRLFTPAEVQRILPELSPVMRAMFLLGLNGAYGQTDLSILRRDELDLDRGIIEATRRKTEIPRVVPLWARTVEALREVIPLRPAPMTPELDAYVFLTRNGEQWTREFLSGRDGQTVIRKDALNEEFTKVLKRLGLKRPRLGFYAVRHTFRTNAGAANDFEATNMIMGHAIDGMSEHYVEFDEGMIERGRRVVSVVEQRLFGAAANSTNQQNGNH